MQKFFAIEARQNVTGIRSDIPHGQRGMSAGK